MVNLAPPGGVVDVSWCGESGLTRLVWWISESKLRKLGNGKIVDEPRVNVDTWGVSLDPFILVLDLRNLDPTQQKCITNYCSLFSLSFVGTRR